MKELTFTFPFHFPLNLEFQSYIYLKNSLIIHEENTKEMNV
jgi:hypothetical protein